MINWIKTEERKPNANDNVIFICKDDNSKLIGFYSEYFGDCKFIAEDYCFELNEVTHWAPVTDINNPEEDKS